MQSRVRVEKLALPSSIVFCVCTHMTSITGWKFHVANGTFTNLNGHAMYVSMVLPTSMTYGFVIEMCN